MPASGRTKLSAGKRILPGRKQVFRRVGSAAGDVIARAEEAIEGQPLLQPVMQGGRRLRPRPTLAQGRAEAAAAVALLPAAVRALPPAQPAYPVAISAGLAVLEAEVRDRIIQAAG